MADRAIADELAHQVVIRAIPLETFEEHVIVFSRPAYQATLGVLLQFLLVLLPVADRALQILRVNELRYLAVIRPILRKCLFELFLLFFRPAFRTRFVPILLKDGQQVATFC